MPRVWAGHRCWRTVTDPLPFGKFSSAIHDVRYRLSWGLLIGAIATGERALIPYRWEQIGSKRVTSSQMQMWSPNCVATRGQGSVSPGVDIQQVRRSTLKFDGRLLSGCDCLFGWPVE
jgi:hypothetical protein